MCADVRKRERRKRRNTAQHWKWLKTSKKVTFIVESTAVRRHNADVRRYCAALRRFYAALRHQQIAASHYAGSFY